MKQTQTYQHGVFYELEEIRPVVSRLKPVTSKVVNKIGLIHLYKEKDSNAYWAGGPFRGGQSNLFLYLGSPESKTQVLDQLKDGLLAAYADNAEDFAEELASLSATAIGSMVLDFMSDIDFDFD